MTVVVGGGIDDMMAYWNAWRLSNSLSSPRALKLHQVAAWIQTILIRCSLSSHLGEIGGVF